MALPIAPLGQLGNMNMPYQIPTYEVTRGRDKVLAALATALAMKGLENVTSRDFAAQPAGFWSKLVQGPQESREQFDKRMAQTAETERAGADRAARERMLGVQIKSEESKESRRALDAKAERDLRFRMSELDADRRAREQAEMLLARGNEQREGFANTLAEIDRRATAQAQVQGEDRLADQQNQIAFAYLQDQLKRGQIDQAAMAEWDTPAGRDLLARARAQELANEETARRLGGGSGVTEADRAALRQQTQGRPTTSSTPVPAATPETASRTSIGPYAAIAAALPWEKAGAVKQATPAALKKAVEFIGPAAAKGARSVGPNAIPAVRGLLASYGAGEIINQLSDDAIPNAIYRGWESLPGMDETQVAHQQAGSELLQIQRMLSDPSYALRTRGAPLSSQEQLELSRRAAFLQNYLQPQRWAR